MRLIILAIGLLLGGCEDGNLTKCDQAIKETLKAPASYKRVKAGKLSPGSYLIDYDAANSFNAPLRARGSCTIDQSGTARWLELSAE